MSFLNRIKSNDNLEETYLVSVLVSDVEEYHIAFSEYEDFVEFVSEQDFSDYEGTGASYKLSEGVVDLKEKDLVSLKRTGYCFIASDELADSLDDLKEIARVSLNEPFQPYDYIDEKSFLFDLKNQFNVVENQVIEM